MSAQAREKKKEIKGEKKRKKKKKNIELDSNLGRHVQTVSLTTRPWEHEATGLTAHKHTYMYFLMEG